MKIAKVILAAIFTAATIAAVAPGPASAAGVLSRATSRLHNSAIALEIRPRRLLFGRVRIGAVSAAQTVTLPNPSRGPFNIYSITTSGPFAISANSCGSSLDPKPATCAVSVTFNPVSGSNPNGIRETGTLVIADSAVNSPQTVKLSGTAFGQSPPAVIFVSNAGIDSVTGYAAGANGDFAPTAVIAGPRTGLNNPEGIAFDLDGNLYVANTFGGPSGTGSIAVYLAGAAGNIAPGATIEGPDTGLAYPEGIAADSNGNIYVVNGNYSVTVYPQGANGDAAPAATISGNSTGLSNPFGIAVDSSGNIYVANTNGGPTAFGSVTVYPAGSNGNAAPSATIGGNTGLEYPAGVAVDNHGNIYVTNQGLAFIAPASVSIYAAGSSGAASPIFTIGAGGELALPTGIAVDNYGNIYVANLAGGSNGLGSITGYPPGGAATPFSAVSGPNTEIALPYGIAILP